MHDQDTPQDEETHAAARALMGPVTARDEAAFQELYDMYCDLVYSIAVQMLPVGDAAAEVLQEVFLKIWNASSLYDPGLGKVVSWLIVITRRCCLNRIRSETRRTAALTKAETEIELSSSPPPAADGMLLRSEDVVAVRAALALLPQDQQEAIRMAFIEDMTHECAAHALDIPLGTLKARIRRGLLQLRRQLDSLR